MKGNWSKLAPDALDIIVTDLATGRKRDIANFSGGEKTLLREVIRMGMSIFQAERSGKQKWDTFFLDESLAELDDINSRKFLDTIPALTRWFLRILFISHDKELTLRAERQVKVSEGRIEDAPGGLFREPGQEPAACHQDAAFSV